LARICLEGRFEKLPRYPRAVCFYNSTDLKEILLQILHEIDEIKQTLGGPIETISSDVLKKMQTDYENFVFLEKKSQDQFLPQQCVQPTPQLPQAARVTEIFGDLFLDAPNDAALANCVGGEYKMGAGISVKFREKYGNISYLKSLKLQPGQVATLPIHSKEGELDKYIFYLVTKPRSANCLPKRVDFKAAVMELANQCKSLGVSTLAIPKIGAGLDRLPWPWVLSVINEAFSGVDTDVLVFVQNQKNLATEIQRTSLPPEKSACPTQPKPTPTVQLKQKEKRRKNKKSPTQRLLADLKKKTVQKTSSPGRGGAPKSTSATVNPAKGGSAGCSTGTCELTGDPTSSAPSPTPSPPQSGEQPCALNPPLVEALDKGEPNAAPDVFPVSSPDKQTEIVDLTTEGLLEETRKEDEDDIEILQDERLSGGGTSPCPYRSFSTPPRTNLSNEVTKLNADPSPNLNFSTPLSSPQMNCPTIEGRVSTQGVLQSPRPTFKPGNVAASLTSHILSPKVQLSGLHSGQLLMGKSNAPEKIRNMIHTTVNKPKFNPKNILHPTQKPPS